LLNDSQKEADPGSERESMVRQRQAKTIAPPLTVRQAYTVAAVAWLRALSNAEHIDFEEAPRIFVRASSQFLFDFPV
jgi:hypothetical protein